MPFNFKYSLSEFQHIMNDIINYYSEFSIVYFEDILIYLKNQYRHFKYLKTFFNVIKWNDLVISSQKIKLFEIKIQFFGYDILNGTN